MKLPNFSLRVMLAGFGLIPAVLPAPSMAQSDAAQASIEVSDQLHVTTLEPVSLAGQAKQAIPRPGSIVSATATIEIRSGSDQAYSVSLSRAVLGSNVVAIEDLAAWSENANRNLGDGNLGSTNSVGRDVVRLSAKFHLPQEVTSDGGTASMTLSFEYQ